MARGVTCALLVLRCSHRWRVAWGGSGCRQSTSHFRFPTGCTLPRPLPSTILALARRFSSFAYVGFVSLSAREGRCFLWCLVGLAGEAVGSGLGLGGGDTGSWGRGREEGTRGAGRGAPGLSLPPPPSVPAVPSHSCDWNHYNMQYALALSQQRGLKRPLGPLGSEEDADTPHDDDDSDSSDDDLHLLRGHGDGLLM